MWVKWTIGAWQELQASRRGYHGPPIERGHSTPRNRTEKALDARGRETASDCSGSRPVALARCAAVAPRRNWGWTTRPAISGMDGWVDGWMDGQTDGWTDGMGSYHGHGRRVRLLPNRWARPGQAEQTINHGGQRSPVGKTHVCSDESAASRAGAGCP